MICCTLNPEKIWHENLTGLSTSPVRCSYFTSEIQKSHFQRYYSYILLIICVISIIHLPASPENITTLTCELQNFFIWLKVCCVLSSVGGSEKSQSWIVVGGSAKNRLWCMATGIKNKKVDVFCGTQGIHVQLHKFILLCAETSPVCVTEVSCRTTSVRAYALAYDAVAYLWAIAAGFPSESSKNSKITLFRCCFKCACTLPKRWQNLKTWNVQNVKKLF